MWLDDRPLMEHAVLKNQPLPARPLSNPGLPGALPVLKQNAAAPGPYRGVDMLDPLNYARLGKPGRPIPVPQAPKPALPRARKTPAEISHLYESSLTNAAMSFHQASLEILEEVTALAPDHANAWRAYAGLLRLAGKDEQAAEADTKAANLAGTETPWRDAVGEHPPEKLEKLDRKMRDKLEVMQPEERIDVLREILFKDPLDVVAMRYLANEEELGNDKITALQVIERALALSPGYFKARSDYAQMLMTRRMHLAAIAQSEYLRAADPNDIRYMLLRADACMQMERFEEALTLFEAALKLEPEHIHALYSYANANKALGRREEAVKTYRTLLSLNPSSGNAYFGLSELKANYLTRDDVVTMHRLLTEGIPEPNSRKCMAYALAQTLERAKDYAGSFEAYEFGAQACKQEAAEMDQTYDPAAFELRLSRLRATFTAEIMAARAVSSGRAAPTTTPIFVIGMPRAGSTLVEQILASHSLVEGTRELPVVSNLTKKIAMSRVLVSSDVYPQRVLEYSRAELDALGEECLSGIAEYRSTNLPYVIDKRPWNWQDAPFIHLMLPQARFIDIRRAPMAAGFAMFKQLLPVDAAFTFDLYHLGHYYRHYCQYMDYLETVMPGRILRVSYETLVDDTEAQIRRMLDYCGLPFEEQCLRFWETDRAVLTPSAEQVRRPIFRDALQQWKNYEPWLGPLKEGLGNLVEA
jgi:tetratricopeptide (TPR) repeat protein